MGRERIEVRIGGGAWIEVAGVVLPLPGARYRVLITGGWAALRAAQPHEILLKIDGAIAAEVRWTQWPAGFAVCEVVLGSGIFPSLLVLSPPDGESGRSSARSPPEENQQRQSGSG